ncbi:MULTISPECIES: YbaB/EbfC family nucleoid-associated protein [unclassified Micromonospora]|uniref:YbaB/EbfC family nucleoid-associated protein n=1 Tax=unclassified Micromonospora TaxID=2617518 RepID=UPI0033E6E1EC
MVDQTDRGPGGRELNVVFAMLAEERRKLDEFQAKMRAASTTVDSPNKMLTATFDGRGELVKLTFNNTKYRAMAPNELSSLLVETLRRGRAESFGKIDEMAGPDVLPGVSFGDLAGGKVDLNEVVGSLLTSAIDLPSIARAARDEAGRADG